MVLLSDSFYSGEAGSAFELSIIDQPDVMVLCLYSVKL